MAPGRSLVELTLDELASCDDAAHIVERSSSRAARGSEQLPRALPDAVAAPVLAIQQDAGQPAQGEAPVATILSRAAAGVSALSESDPRELILVPAGQTSLQKTYQPPRVQRHPPSVHPSLPQGVALS